jgi:hypothetical protein
MSNWNDSKDHAGLCVVPMQTNIKIVMDTMLQIGRPPVRFPMRSLDFLIGLILPSTLRR